MYSVLIEENTKWKYLTNSDGTRYIASSLVAVQEKVKEILKEVPLGQISVVKNCTISESIVVTENGVSPEPEQETEPEVEQNQG